MRHILDKIKEYDKIIILGHLNPDGDCYGSQFGLKNIIETTYPNKKVYTSGGECSFASFLGKMDKLQDEDFTNSLVITVDTPNELRVHDKRLSLASYVIKIDHHYNELEEMGNYRWTDTSAPSCSIMITEFFDIFKSELKMTIIGATALYVGIVTDTGRFRYESVTAKTFRLSAMLLDYGIKVNEIDKLLSTESLETLRVKGYILSNLKTTKEGFIYILFDKGTVSCFNVKIEEISNQVNILANIDGYPMWALLLENDNEIRIRLRSNGPVINDLAAKFNGGGHKKAAGAKLANWNELSSFLNACDQHLIEYKKTL